MKKGMFILVAFMAIVSLVSIVSLTSCSANEDMPDTEKSPVEGKLEIIKGAFSTSERVFAEGGDYGDTILTIFVPAIWYQPHVVADGDTLCLDAIPVLVAQWQMVDGLHYDTALDCLELLNAEEQVQDNYVLSTMSDWGYWRYEGTPAAVVVSPIHESQIFNDRLLSLSFEYKGKIYHAQERIIFAFSGAIVPYIGGKLRGFYWSAVQAFQENYPDKGAFLEDKIWLDDVSQYLY